MSQEMDLRHAPGPQGHYILGNLLELRRDPLGFLVKSAEEFGDVVKLRFGPNNVYLLNRPADVDHVFRHNHQNYVKSDKIKLFRMFLGDGILVSEGERWKTQRRHLQPHFNQQHLARAADITIEAAEQMLVRWRNLSPSMIIDVTDEMLKLTVNIITRAMFGVIGVTDINRIEYAINAGSDLVLRKWLSPLQLPTWLPTWNSLRLRHTREALSRLLEDIVSRREMEPLDENQCDLLGAMLLARQQEIEPPSRKDLQDQIITLFVAGHETTAMSLAWTWYLLGNNPSCLKKVADEAWSIYGDRRPSYADVSKLTYTLSVFRESLRLFPPVWSLSRRSKATDKIGSYHVPARTTVMTSPYVIHRSPQIWGEKANEFDPDRFTKPEIAQREQQWTRASYLPFGLGPRHCIGEGFATMEALLILSMVAREFRPILLTSTPVVPVPLITIRPNTVKATLLKATPADQTPNMLPNGSLQ